MSPNRRTPARPAPPSSSPCERYREVEGKVCRLPLRRATDLVAGDAQIAAPPPAPVSRRLAETEAAIRHTDELLAMIQANLQAMSRFMRTPVRQHLFPRQPPRDFWQTYALLWLPLVTILCGFFFLGYYLGSL